MSSAAADSKSVEGMSEREFFGMKARLAEQTERFEDMVVWMKKLVELGGTLTIEERNQLSVAYKNVIGSRRASWRVLTSLEHKQFKDQNTVGRPILDEYRKTVEKELLDICNEVLGIIENLLQPNEKNNGESKVFYTKMQGDYYRYISEFTIDNERAEAAEKARKAYKEATDLALSELAPTHPIRLGLALNFSVFHYEICNSPTEACKLAKSAFDEAIAELDTLSEESYKDSTLIMQLLRDNLTLWTNDLNTEEKGEEEKADEVAAH